MSRRHLTPEDRARRRELFRRLAEARRDAPTATIRLGVAQIGRARTAAEREGETLRHWIESRIDSGIPTQTEDTE
jgi:hypothetical protein